MSTHLVVVVAEALTERLDLSPQKLLLCTVVVVAFCDCIATDFAAHPPAATAAPVIAIVAISSRKSPKTQKTLETHKLLKTQRSLEVLKFLRTQKSLGTQKLESWRHEVRARCGHTLYRNEDAGCVEKVCLGVAQNLPG